MFLIMLINNVMIPGCSLHASGGQSEHNSEKFMRGSRFEVGTVRKSCRSTIMPLHLQSKGSNHGGDIYDRG